MRHGKNHLKNNGNSSGKVPMRTLLDRANAMYHPRADSHPVTLMLDFHRKEMRRQRKEILNRFTKRIWGMQRSLDIAAKQGATEYNKTQGWNDAIRAIIKEVK